MALYSLSLCAGVGALDLGVAIACPGSRAVVFVEREAYAAAVLLARMEESSLEPAPIWDCLETFDGRPWRGAVDIVTAGFPCQPWSCAGKRKGTADERWIWDDIARIIREVGPGLVLLENVPGLISGGGLGLVLGSLAALGFDAEWGVLKASAVGAPHERERVFILAFAESFRREGVGRQPEKLPRPAISESDVADPGSLDGRLAEEPRKRDQAAVPTPVGEKVAHTAGSGRQRSDRGAEVRIHHEGCPQLDDPEGAVLEAGCGCGSPYAGPERAGAFPPGRDDPAWLSILADYPHLAPAIEPGFRVLFDGTSLLLDASRADQIRCIGNGVVALQAAAAFRLLAARAGIRLGPLRAEEA